MRNPWLLALLLILPAAGCLEAPPDVAASAPSPPATNETPSPAPDVAMGLLGNATTTNESIEYYANSTSPVVVTLRLNGTVLSSETLEGNRTWTLPLAFGQTPLNVTVEGAGLALAKNLTLVRLGKTTLTIDYCYYHPSSPTVRKRDAYTIWIDVDSRPSEPLYQKAGAKHPDRFSAHDQLYLFEQLTRIPVEVQYFASLQGFAVNKIDRVGNPVTSSAPPYWLYTVNGKEATGMSLQPVGPEDRVAWSLTCAG